MAARLTIARAANPPDRVDYALPQPRCGPFAPVCQLVEHAASKTVQCGFESHPGYTACGTARRPIHPGLCLRFVSGRGDTVVVYSSEVRLRALALIENEFSLRAISMSTGISRAALREWRNYPQTARSSRTSCPRCSDTPTLPAQSADYAYLLGLYLGDGCISPAGDPAKGVWKLRVICCDARPGLIGECARAMRAVRPGNKVMTTQKEGCTEVLSCSRHWPCRGWTSLSGRSTD
jgi:hypothetical protein